MILYLGWFTDVIVLVVPDADHVWNAGGGGLQHAKVVLPDPRLTPGVSVQTDTRHVIVMRYYSDMSFSYFKHGRSENEQQTKHRQSAAGSRGIRRRRPD